MSKPKIVIMGNGNDWCEKSLTDIKYYENTKLINTPLPYTTKGIVAKLIKLHYSQTIEKYFELPFKRVWYSFFSKYISDNPNEPLVLVIYDRNRLANNIPFLMYLRNHFKTIKLVYVFTNIVKISGAGNNNFLDKLNDYFDVVYAFDPNDAIKYNFKYSPLVYSDNSDHNIEIEDDVFYIGRAKDRYSMLISVFERLLSFGLKTNFSIYGVPESQQKYTDYIKYNVMVPYDEVLKHIQKANCLLDVIQGESEGFTIKVCEAVFYNKLLITTNKKIYDAPFFNPNYIKVICDANDITEEFFTNCDKVYYSQEDKSFFSVDTFLNRILVDTFGK